VRWTYFALSQKQLLPPINPTTVTKKYSTERKYFICKIKFQESKLLQIFTFRCASKLGVIILTKSIIAIFLKQLVINADKSESILHKIIPDAGDRDGF
jgi:hypothetical protein